MKAEKPSQCSNSDSVDLTVNSSSSVRQDIVNEQTEFVNIDSDVQNLNIEHEEEPTGTSMTVEGRRIVNVQHLCTKMFCGKCQVRLHFQDIVKEHKMGLASYFTFKCPLDICQHRTVIGTDTRSAHGPFDVNSKAVLGIFFYSDYISQ